MRIKQIQDINYQHVVAVERDGVLRCYHRCDSLQLSCRIKADLESTIRAHGGDTEFVGYSSLPRVIERESKRGRPMYEVEVGNEA